jgi:threonine/homoserine/homoserine lactone efflux protein
MTAWHAIAAFAAAAVVLSVTPGLDTALLLRTTAAGGRRQGLLAAIGVNLGCLVWGSAASVGLGALLAASTLAYTVLKWAGAAYLVWVGAGLVLRPRDRLAPAGSAGEGGAEARPDPSVAGWRPLLQGFLTNILNPKVGVFYITFLPQFIPTGANVMTFSLLLTVIQASINLAWFALLLALSVRIGRAMRRPGVVRVLDRLTGTVFVGFGARLAFER